MSRSRPKSRRSAGIPAGIGRQAYRARTRPGVLGILAALVSCVAISACSVPGAAPPYDDRVLLGQGDRVVVPKQGPAIDRYTCGRAVMLCEDRISERRCECTVASILH